MTTETITTDAKTAEMIEKIGKLLAQANSAASVGNTVEADAFTEKAFRLMAKYDIQAAQITNTTGEVKDELIVWDYEIVGEFAIDQTTLFFDVVSGVGARALRYRKRVPGTRQSYTYTMRVWGFESQTKRIKFLFESLLPQMLVGSAAAAAIVTWESKRSYRKTWMEGFGSAIAGRLVKARSAAVQEANEEEAGSGTSAELVLADKKAKVTSFFDQATTRVTGNGKKVKTYTNSVRKLSGTGRSAGYRAGQSASFGDNTIGGGRLALSR
jgi:hypothetical protein